jgi:hypothetical protein
MLQFSPIFEPDRMWEKCQILVPWPISQPSSIYADSWAKYELGAWSMELGVWRSGLGVWGFELRDRRSEVRGRRSESNLLLREILQPFSSKERWEAFRILRTRRPSLPSVSGFVPFDRQPRKCSHSRCKGSFSGISNRSGSALAGTGILSCNLFSCCYWCCFSGQGWV